MPSEEHNELEEKAIAWLRQQGFVDILVEARISVVGDSAGEVMTKDDHPPFGSTLRPDVVGFSSTRKVIVECGSPGPVSRLFTFRNLGYEIYIWPYGEEEPYRVTRGVSFCSECGHRFKSPGRPYSLEMF